MKKMAFIMMIYDLDIFKKVNGLKKNDKAKNHHGYQQDINNHVFYFNNVCSFKMVSLYAGQKCQGHKK